MSDHIEVGATFGVCHGEFAPYGEPVAVGAVDEGGSDADVDVVDDAVADLIDPGYGFIGVAEECGEVEYEVHIME